MKQLSLKKYSLLGLVLIAASAVTAAMASAKTSPDEKVAQNGQLVNGVDAGGQTCVAVSVNRNCHDTLSGVNDASSTTHASPDDSSDDDGVVGGDTNTTGEDNA